MPVVFAEGVGVKRYSAGPTPLGYEMPWKHEFRVTEFRVEDVPPPAFPPEECGDHYPNCFVASATSPWRSYCEGTWKMLSPIDIPSEMPGRDRELLTISAAAMDTDVGGWCEAHSELYIYVDGARRWYSGEMPFKQNEWNNKTWSLNMKLGDAKKLELRIWQSAAAYIYGGVRRHVAGHDGNPILLTGRYFTDKPPEMADVIVRVLDRYTTSPVRRAYVALKVGDVVKADGYTGSDGRVTFKNIEEGSYALYVQKEGYHDVTTGIDVKPPRVEKTVYLTPLPTKPFPWEWVAVGGLVIVGGGTLMALARRRKPEERIVVVK
jgi:hypothetical protein